MDWVWAIIACVLFALSFVGCVVPVVPGPALAYGGLLVLMPSSFAPTTQTYIWFGVACVVGTLVGIFFVPWGILVGPFAGAVVGELIAGKKFASSLKGGFGALLGFIFGVALKLAYCACCAGWCVALLIKG